MVSLWKRQSRSATADVNPAGGTSTSRDVLSHVNKDTVGHIIGQSDDMIDNLFVMRLYLSFYIPLMGSTPFSP